jgi:hypothetical protein
MTTPYPPNPPTGDNQPMPPQPVGGYPQPWPSADGSPYGANQPPPASAYPPAAGYPQYPQPYGAVPQLKPVPPRRQNNAIIGLIVAIIVIAVAVAAGAAALLRQATTMAGSIDSYTAAKPGPNCDTGGGQWQSLDSSLSGRCQSNGFLLTRIGAADTIGEVFFQSPTSEPITFPSSYKVQIDATIESGDGHAAVGLSAHRQAGGGAQFFLAGEDGQWRAVKVDSTGTHATQMTTGFLLQPTKTYHLEVDVASAVITFSINGTQVTTVTDGDYPSTDALSFALIDPQSPIPPSALFSNFSYTAQPDSTLSDGAAEATATATTQQTLQSPYHAAIPGPGCDTGGGQWPSLRDLGETHTTARCTSAGLVISQASKTSSTSLVPFFNRDGNFPANYSVGVQVTTTGLHGGCTGVMTRGNLQTADAYIFVLCDFKSYFGWLIATFDGSNLTALQSGKAAVKSSYLMTATANGSTQSLSLNGHTVGKVTDDSLTTTGFVALVVIPNPQVTATISATFKNFAFTPLP